MQMYNLPVCIPAGLSHLKRDYVGSPLADLISLCREYNKRADALANLAMDGKGWRGVVDAQV